MRCDYFPAKIGKIRQSFNGHGLGRLNCDGACVEWNFEHRRFNIADNIYRQTLASVGANSADLTIMSFERLSDTSNKLNKPTSYFHYTVLWVVFALKTHGVAAVYHGFWRLEDYFVGEGDKSAALSVFQFTSEDFTYLDIHRGRADCMLRIGDILDQQGRVHEAQEMWKDARPLFIRSSQARDTARCDERLASLSRLASEAG